ncbi:MAG: phage holin family protein [Actinomycetota bacterium]|nr:phage holin family protein [Actinomycetota bacterium]
MSPPSAGLPWKKQSEPKGVGAQVGDLKDLVVGYAKQETVDPLKTLGRYLGYGLAGSVSIGGGLVLLLLALLRGLQEISVFNDPSPTGDSRWSWTPYAITAAVGLLIAGLFLWKLVKMINGKESR